MSAFADTDLLTEEQKFQFVRLLEAGLDLQQNDGQDTWKCLHNYEFVHARRALDQLGLSTETTEQLLRFFQKNGGYCDCEIMLNVVVGDDGD